jgi:hypothetical protein
MPNDVRENRLRRAARRQMLELSKSRRRDPRAPDHGKYCLRDRDAGYPFDRKHAAIARVWKGISNTKARKETIRKAKPLLANDLRDLIDGLDQQSASGARDAARHSLAYIK